MTITTDPSIGLRTYVSAPEDNLIAFGGVEITPSDDTVYKPNSIVKSNHTNTTTTTTTTSGSSTTTTTTGTSTVGENTPSTT